MTNRAVLLIVATLGALGAKTAVAARNGCSFVDPPNEKTPELQNAPGGVIVASAGASGGARLVAKLVDAPRTKVTLSIDDSLGTHFELVWDPAINDGLQHSIVLPDGTWRLSPSVDDDRIQTGQVVVAFSTTFPPADTHAGPNSGDIQFSGTTEELLANAQMKEAAKPVTVSSGRPQIYLSCEAAQVDIADLRLDARKVAAAVATRSVLDQSVPAPLADALSILTEIAIERGKAGAMALLKQKFVEPMCAKLTLQLFSLGDKTKSTIALPRSCALLEQLRVDDVLSSGKSLFDAVKDDVRETIAPALLDRLQLNDETRELAHIALNFANRLVDGETSSVVAVDMLIAEIERVPWSGGFEGSLDIVVGWLNYWAPTTGPEIDRFERAFLGDVLPANLNDIPNPNWRGVPGCWRDYGDHPSQTLSEGFPIGKYQRADRQACIGNLLRYLNPPVVKGAAPRPPTLEAWVRRGIDVKVFATADVAAFLHSRATVSLSQWLLDQYRGAAGAADRTDDLRRVLPASAAGALANACTARLLVGVVKWCGARESCSAGDIADVVDHPAKYFAPSKHLPDSLCWNANGTFAYPPDKRALELGAQLVSFLQPPLKGEEQQRAISMIRWMFDLVNMLNSTADSTTQTESDSVVHLEDIVTLIINHDYLRATTESFSLATALCARAEGQCEASGAAKKAMQLIGAVASYVQTYEETKSASETDARAARKKAMESLIDAATDRSSRAGDSVVSIGSPVGFATGFRWIPGTNANYHSSVAAFDLDYGFQWRVPLAIAWQKLPGAGGYRAFPTHAALWIADLGQFARSSESGANNDISWKDFIGIGGQLGYLIGTSDHAVVLAVEGSWSPGLYGRDEVIKASDGTTSTVHVSGAFTLGVTLAYYVPFFDFD